CHCNGIFLIRIIIDIIRPHHMVTGIILTLVVYPVSLFERHAAQKILRRLLLALYRITVAFGAAIFCLLFRFGLIVRFLCSFFLCLTIFPSILFRCQFPACTLILRLLFLITSTEDDATQYYK